MTHDGDMTNLTGSALCNVFELPSMWTALAHLVHDDFTLSWFGHVDHSLDDVVCVLVFHHGVQGTVGPVFLTAYLIYKQSSLCTWWMDHTFLHNVTGGEKKIISTVCSLQIYHSFCSNEWSYPAYLANLCWLRTRTFPRTSATILLLSSGLPCSRTCWIT